jgi:subtilisin family serine protease
MLINAYNDVRLMKNRGINIRVTNNSYSGCDEACGYDQATKDALDAMGNAGILNIFAAGNNAINNDTSAAPNYPATYTSPSVLAVAASTSTDIRASFSAYGPTSVDLAAPGSGILSTTNTSNSSYGGNSGTSMAPPHVTGAAASP